MFKKPEEPQKLHSDPLASATDKIESVSSGQTLSIDIDGVSFNELYETLVLSDSNLEHQ